MPAELISAEMKARNPNVLYVHIKDYGDNISILDAVIAPLDHFKLSLRDDGGLRVRSYDFDYNTPQKDKTVLAVMRYRLEKSATEKINCDILARGVSTSMQKHGVMKLLSINVLQTLCASLGDIIIKSSPMHIATAYFFATQETERTEAKALTDPETGKIKYGTLEMSKPVSELLRYHHHRLHHTPQPATTTKAGLFAELKPSRADKKENLTYSSPPGP